MSAILLLTIIPVVLGATIVVVKMIDQKWRDSNRKTYRLSFPRDLDADRVSAWIRSISGTLRPGNRFLGGTPTIVFEMWATDGVITHRLKVPWQHADYVIAQLRSLVSGIRVTPEDEFPQETWTSAVEVRLTNSSRPLRIYSQSDMSASLLASVQALNEGETMLMQWVVTPAVPTHPPIHQTAKTNELKLHHLITGNMATRDEVNDRRKKLEEPNMMAVLRVASVAETKVRAEHLIYRVRASLASVRGPASRFEKRIVSAQQVQRRIDEAAGSVNYPIQLATSELAALIAWPVGNPNVVGLPPALSRHLPPNESIPREGRIVGRSNMPGNERPIAISYVDALKHVHISGPTGVGKTVLLANMMRQDIAQGYGVVLIENKGDLFEAALNYIPPNRINDVVILDINDTKMPVGFNILRQGDPRVMVDEITTLFDHLYPEARGVWTREVLYHGLRTLGDHPGTSFIDLSPFLVPMSTQETAWRDSIIKATKDKELRNFWHRFEGMPRASQDRIVQPVMDRIWQLNARPELRNIIGQSTSSFLMDDIVRDNKILLVNLAGIARDTASLTGTLLMNALWHSVKTTRSDRPTYLYLDEFEDFLDLPIDPEDMLAKARGFGLGMTLAHQHLGQLPPPMRQAVLANARTKIVFQTSAADAGVMAREFGPTVEDHDFMHLGRYEAIARIATGDGVSTPITLATNEPARGYGRANQVRWVSRKTYGRPVTEVEEQIEKRRTTVNQTSSRPRPKISGEGWG